MDDAAADEAAIAWTHEVHVEAAEAGWPLAALAGWAGGRI